jgi:Uma2 family endonuclease
LVVEVADTTLQCDFEIKRHLYARARVAELWIVDMDRRELHVFGVPEQNYSLHCVQVANDFVTAAALGDVGFAVSALYPH